MKNIEQLIEECIKEPFAAFLVLSNLHLIQLEEKKDDTDILMHYFTKERRFEKEIEEIKKITRYDLSFIRSLFYHQDRKVYDDLKARIA